MVSDVLLTAGAVFITGTILVAYITTRILTTDTTTPNRRRDSKGARQSRSDTDGEN